VIDYRVEVTEIKKKATTTCSGGGSSEKMVKMTKMLRRFSVDSGAARGILKFHKSGVRDSPVAS
jgi:hypothetical protein